MVILMPRPPMNLEGTFPPDVMTHSVERDCNVSKAPGAIVLIWLSYNERRRTLRSPVKLSLWMQLMRLFLNILEGRKSGEAAFTTRDFRGIRQHPSHPLLSY